VPHGPLFSPLITKNRGRGGPPRHPSQGTPRSGLRGANGRWAQPGASSLQGLRPALQRTRRRPTAPQRPATPRRPTTPRRPAAPTSCGAHPRRRPPFPHIPWAPRAARRPGAGTGAGRQIPAKPVGPTLANLCHPQAPTRRLPWPFRAARRWSARPAYLPWDWLG
jgi:hypothetical protein